LPFAALVDKANLPVGISAFFAHLSTSAKLVEENISRPTINPKALINDVFP